MLWSNFVLLLALFLFPTHTVNSLIKICLQALLIKPFFSDQKSNHLKKKKLGDE